MKTACFSISSQSNDGRDAVELTDSISSLSQTDGAFEPSIDESTSGGGGSASESTSGWIPYMYVRRINYDFRLAKLRGRGSHHFHFAYLTYWNLLNQIEIGGYIKCLFDKYIYILLRNSQNI